MKSYNLSFTVKGEQYSYNLSSEDRLDLIRAVAREGKPYDAVTWSLIQRFAWLYPRGNFPTLSSFVKAYAQPINPRWFPTGDKFLAYIRSLKRNYTGNELTRRLENAIDKAENRLEYASAELDEISDKYINTVDSILSGNQSNPVKGAIHYIASTGGNDETTAKQAQLAFAENRTDLSEPIYYGSSTTGHNWFFAVPGSKQLIAKILSELAPTNIVNVGTQDSPAMGLVFILSGVAAKKLAEELMING